VCVCRSFVLFLIPAFPDVRYGQEVTSNPWESEKGGKGEML
jgi:hypothetical protein